ncbi:quinone-dependent dihydroorotate dehydrogenase [Synechococcus elongatus]|uniref:quinone-dependent dihydroorotate dehydrogenase n=1 Tax=Synechococcus elongatus TaxID=32046 RepID=UPI000F7DE22F|nr:quinone-dependent dihydroorotate dehydrogenase [Synechococcus elongatus]
MDFYRLLLRPLLLSQLNVDPEWLTRNALGFLARLARSRSPLAANLRSYLRQTYGFQDPRLAMSLLGLTFATPVGLAAGFDKDGIAAPLWSDLGFGFAELGTVTALAQPGNPRPRLFRIPQDLAAFNRMGFNNASAEALADTLRGYFPEGQRSIPIGINLGKSKLTPLSGAVSDYVSSFRSLRSLGDYFVVNVSSPNTPGLRSLQAVTELEPILAALQAENTEQRPLLLKIAPDLVDEEVVAIAHLAQRQQLAGIIATNTTIDKSLLSVEHLPGRREPLATEAGGISGAPLRSRSTEVIRLLHRTTQGQLPIIGVGGIFSAEDAWQKIVAGASLVQVYTGWVYEGPLLVKTIQQGLLERLDSAGLPNLAAAVGSAAIDS